MKSELVPMNGDPPIPITRDVTLLGRREFCDVRIEHPSLSKRHAVLVRTDGLLIIRDLISTNGTKVNGQRVMWAALLPNDRVTLGRYKFRVYLGPDDALSPSELGQRRAPGAQAGPGPKARGGPEAQVGFAAPSPLSVPVVDASGQVGNDPNDPDTDSDGLEEIEEEAVGFALIDDDDDDDDEIIELD